MAHLEECAGILQPLLYLSGNIWLVSTTEGLKAGDPERQCPIVLQADPLLHGHKLSQQLETKEGQALAEAEHRMLEREKAAMERALNTRIARLQKEADLAEKLERDHRKCVC